MAAGTGEAGADADEDPLGEVPESPSMDVGMQFGVGLALVALVWAVVGPSHLLEVGRYEWPIVASFVEPLPVRFFLYLGGVTFGFALAAALAFPRLADPEDWDAIDLAIGLLIPIVVLTAVVALLGFVVPAVFYAVTGEVLRAGLILVGVAILLVVADAKRTVALLVVGIWSAPLWVAAFAGAGLGGRLREGLGG